MRSWAALCLARVAAGALVAVACSAPPARPERLPVEFAGCKQVLQGPICGLGTKRSLRLWLPIDKPESVRLSVDGRHLPAQPRPVHEGWQLTIELPPGARQLSARLQADGRVGVWKLLLTEAPQFERLVQALRLHLSGEHAAAKALIEAAVESDDPVERAWAFGSLGRLRFGEADARGAISALEQAIALQERHGCASCAVNDATVLAFLLTYQTREFERARQILERFDVDAYPDPQAGALVPYYQGMLAAESGDLRAALCSLREAQQAAERLGLNEFARSAAQMRARVLPSLGRFDEAVTAMTALRDAAPEGIVPCEQAALLHNLGWVGLLAHEARGQAAGLTLAEVERSLTAALALHETQCQRRSDAGSLLIDLALVALHHGDLRAARRWLQQAEQILPAGEPRLLLWQLDIEGRLALASGRTGKASRLFGRLAGLAQMADAPDAAWRATIGRARALRAARRIGAALEAYAAAEHLLQSASQRVALGDGRDTFLGSHARGTAEYVELLIAQGDAQQAVQVARRAARRALLSVARRDRVGSLSAAERAVWQDQIARYRRGRDALEQAVRDGWGLAAEVRAQRAAAWEDERARLRQALDAAFAVLEPGRPAASSLRKPEPGELLLVYYPTPAAWLLFGVDARAIVSHRTEPPDPAADPARLGELLLAPFDAQLAASDRVRVLAAGAAASVDVHALPWRGAPLVQRRPVVYGIDLPPAQGAKPDPSKRAALVVADPRGDLPGARREAREVRASMDAQAFSPVVQLVDAAASPQAVRRELARAGVAHFAGHGEFASTGGLTSALALAAGGKLRVSDVMALPQVPRVVVLAGCQTARTQTRVSVQGLGLAQAFLLGGASATVATSRPVKDSLSRALARGFYKNLEGLDTWQVAAALRAAQMALGRQQPDVDWAAYRAVVP